MQSYVTTGSAIRRLATAALIAASTAAAHAEVIEIGIGTQHTTTNTVNGGVVVQKLGLLEKHLPRSGKYKDVEYRIDWRNFTSGPPVTNGMVANKLHIGMMGDYPLLVNGATFQNATDTESRLVMILAYNASGAGNGVVVHTDSPYYQLSDLKGKKVSVPFGSAAHGMLLKAMEDLGWKASDVQLASQSPEVGTTNLQEKKIDAHADFVPFAELLPFRGFARKIFDGVETGIPTFHGVVVRDDFAKKHPDIVVAYVNAVLEANEWIRRNPKEAAEKIEEWTKIEKEVVYMFLGPGGIHTMDPTIKPEWIEAIKYDHGVLQRMGRVKGFDADRWVDDSYVRTAMKLRGLDYDAQRKSFQSYDLQGRKDAFCNATIENVKLSGEIWVAGGDIEAFSSPRCTLAAVKKYRGEGRKINVVYLRDQASGIKVFADRAFYALLPKHAAGPQIVPFLLKKDAEAHARKIGARLATYDEALAAATVAD